MFNTTTYRTTTLPPVENDLLETQNILAQRMGLPLPGEASLIQTKPEISLAPEGNIHEGAKREQVGEEPVTANVGGEDLNEIASNTDHLALMPSVLATLQVIAERLQINPMIEQELTGNSAASQPGDHTDKRAGRRPPRTGAMQVGQFKSNPSRATQFIGWFGGSGVG